MTRTSHPHAPPPGRDPEAVVRTFFRRLAAGDVAGVEALLHPEFVFRDAGGAFVARREDMGSMISWDAAAEGHVRIRSLAVEGEAVTVRVRESNRFTDLLALEPWDVDATFTVRDGLILEEVARERVGEGPSFGERFQRALRPVVEWAVRTRPREAGAVFEDGRVTKYDGPTARRLLRLLEACPGIGGPTEGGGREGG